MSWSPMSPIPPLGHGTRRDAFVSVGALAKSARCSPCLLLVLRPYLLPDGPAWLVAGSEVSVMLGHGEHAGMIRIVPGRPFKLGRTSTNLERKPVLQLRLPLPPGVSEEKRKAAPVDYDYSDTWLEITLPDWARVGGPAAPAPAAALGAALKTGNATLPARGVALAEAAAAIARKKAGLT